MAKDFFCHRSSPAASLRGGGNPQGLILDEAVPEPTKAPWTAAHVGTRAPLTPKNPSAPQVQKSWLTFCPLNLPTSIVAQHCDLLEGFLLS